MIIYLAGGESHINSLLKSDIDNILVSYFYIKTRKPLEIMKIAKFKNIFLDSGGYTARVKNININIDNYCNFIKKYQFFKTYANLDTASEKESMNNYIYMKEQGLNPLPIWHPSWSKSSLKKYLRKNDKICIGGLIGSKEKKNISKYNQVMSIIKLIKGIKEIKIHLFGATDILLLNAVKRYIYSADSTSWLAGEQYGLFYYFDKSKHFLKSIKSSTFRDKFKRSFRMLNYTTITYWNILQWKQYIDYMEGR